MGWLLALWVGLAPPVDAAPADRPPADYMLEWEAPPECPTAEEIEAQVGALTEDRLDGDGTMVVRGVVHQDAAGQYHLKLTTTVGEREAVRELEASECVDLGQAVALVVAVTLVPSLEEGPEPEAEPESEAEPEPESEAEAEPDALEPQPPVVAERVETPQPRPRPPPRKEPPSRSRRAITPPRVLLRAGLGLDVGGAPTPTLASRLAVGAVWAHLRVAIEGTHLVPQRADGPGSADGLVQQGTVGLVGCGAFAWRAWSLPICGGVEAGFLRADSRGTAPRRSAGGLVVSPMRDSVSSGTGVTWGCGWMLKGSCAPYRPEWCFGRTKSSGRPLARPDFSRESNFVGEKRPWPDSKPDGECFVRHASRFSGPL